MWSMSRLQRYVPRARTRRALAALCFIITVPVLLIMLLARLPQPSIAWGLRRVFVDAWEPNEHFYPNAKKKRETNTDDDMATSSISISSTSSSSSTAAAGAAAASTGASSAMVAGDGNVRYRYGVVFDAGSTGSRVHAYRFRVEESGRRTDNGGGNNDDGGGAGSAQKTELIDDGFFQIEPGLSSYSGKPDDAAASLKPLLESALKLVPAQERPKTCIELRATAGLRLLPGNAADAILASVRDVLASTEFELGTNGVTVLGGAEEGAYAWVALNYLLGNLGGAFSSTAAIVDLGGGSVQIAYALPPGDAEMRGSTSETDGDVRVMSGGGKSYSVYVHSFLGFGLMAARAEMLSGARKISEKENPCILKGSNDSYEYTEQTYSVSNMSGADVQACIDVIRSFMEPGKACGRSSGCSFSGVWGGGGGQGLRRVKLLSYFVDRASQTGVIEDESEPSAYVQASEFLTKAREVCSANVSDVPRLYPRVKDKDAAFLCFDLLYQHMLVTEGLGIGGGADDDVQLELVKRVRYRETEVEAGWALGSAISSLDTCA